MADILDRDGVSGGATAPLAGDWGCPPKSFSPLPEGGWLGSWQITSACLMRGGHYDAVSRSQVLGETVAAALAIDSGALTLVDPAELLQDLLAVRYPAGNLIQGFGGQQ